MRRMSFALTTEAIMNQNYDPVWRDGEVCCSGCGLRLRGYDAG